MNNVFTGMITLFNSKKRSFLMYCEHHPALAKTMAPVRKLWMSLGLGHAIYNLDPKVQAEKKNRQRCCELHSQELTKLSDMLEDDFSRHTLERVLEFWKTWDMHVLKDILVEPQYFQKDIFGPVKDEVFLDGGAYIGDTVMSFIKNFSGGGINVSMPGNRIQSILLH